MCVVYTKCMQVYAACGATQDGESQHGASQVVPGTAKVMGQASLQVGTVRVMETSTRSISGRVG